MKFNSLFSAACFQHVLTMGKGCSLFLQFAIIFLAAWSISAVHVRGQWKTDSRRVKVLTKFGFQQNNRLDRLNTRGFVFGNVTSNSNQSSRPVIFALVPQTMIRSLHSDSIYGGSCAVIMQNLSRKAFESRCFNDGQRGDFLRWIPCPKGNLCKDEDDPTVVLPHSQLTMQVEEPTTAEYWFVVLVACDLDDNCTWTSSNTKSTIDYDLWLTNGKPGSAADSPFTLQFSFDEQNTIEIYLLTFSIYVILSAVMQRAILLCKQSSPPPRMRILSYVIHMKTIGVALQALNVLIFSIDGEGIFLARVLGEVLRLLSIDLFCLLLILLSRGWGFSARPDAPSKCCLAFWGILATAHLILFFCNLVFIYDTMHEVDIFTSWPGYGILGIRILYALWFLFEIRSLITREQNEERAEFLAHIGAGFLVWFVYLPGLGVVASFISQLWRFKIILGITTVANYIAIACVLHLFWPIGSYRKFFQDDYNYHRRMLRTESHEMQDYERLLFESSDSDADFPEVDPVSNIHAI